MQEIFNKVGVSTRLPKKQNKHAIFDAIHDSAYPHVTKIDINTFRYLDIIIPEHIKKGSMWKTEVELPEGSAFSDVEEVFFAPTNKENVPDVPKYKYPTDSPNEWPQFAKKPRKEKSSSNAPHPVDCPPSNSLVPAIFQRKMTILLIISETNYHLPFSSIDPIITLIYKSVQRHQQWNNGRRSWNPDIQRMTTL